MHDDILPGVLNKLDVSRRAFVVSTLATGFALSVQPTGAQTITTDTTGLEAGEVKIPVKDGEMPAYRAMPAEPGPFPVVLVVQEIFGVHEHIKDLCRRLAKVGYLAVAPELYARQGDVSKMTDIQEVISKVVSKVPDEQVMSDLDATVAWAGKSGKGDVKRLAVTGFCWGGRIVWLYAAHNPNLKAGAAWYGRLKSNADRAASETPDRRRLRPQGPCARSLRRRRSRHPGRRRREDAAGAQGRESRSGNHPLPRHSARFQCRLPPELSQGASRRRLEADARVVQEERRRVRRPVSMCRSSNTSKKQQPEG